MALRHSDSCEAGDSYLKDLYIYTNISFVEAVNILLTFFILFLQTFLTILEYASSMSKTRDKP